VTALSVSRAMLAVSQRVVMERDNGCCVVCGEAMQQIHHRRPRGMGGSSNNLVINMAGNLIAVCNADHAWIESNRDRARDNGWLIPQAIIPVTVPLWWFGRFVLLDNDGRYEVTTP